LSFLAPLAVAIVTNEISCATDLGYAIHKVAISQIPIGLQGSSRPFGDGSILIDAIIGVSHISHGRIIGGVLGNFVVGTPFLLELTNGGPFVAGLCLIVGTELVPTKGSFCTADILGPWLVGTILRLPRFIDTRHEILFFQVWILAHNVGVSALFVFGETISGVAITTVT